jgi:NADPH:quinone reductase
MKAIVMDTYGGPDVLRLADVARPHVPAGKLLIRVRAIGVNPADPKWRSGMFASFRPLTFPHIPGYDIAGIVEEADADGAFPHGTRVAVNLNPLRHGAYAEYAVADPDCVAEIPEGVSFDQAAAVPTPGLTGTQMIEEHLQVQAGERVLITGATGAVGRFALYAAKARLARIVAAVRTTQRREALTLGADEVLTLGEPWEGAPFDCVADTVGGTAVGKLCRSIGCDARIVTAATTPIPVAGLASAPSFMAVHADAASLARLLRAIAKSEMRVPIAHTFKLADAAAAHRLVEAGGVGGKVILVP